MNAVVRTDKMFGTDNRAGLVSVRVSEAIDNGNVIKLGALETGSREVYTGTTPAAGDALKDIVLIASPEVMYDERIHDLAQFTNAAGTIARGYYLHTNDIFSVTKEALVGAEIPAVGNVVELTAGTKLNVVETATEGSTVVGTVIDVNVVGRYTYFVIQVA